MIVRIATEGQYNLDSKYLDRLNAVDDQIVEAIGSQDQAKFNALFRELIEMVREHGEPVGADELVESQVVLPPPDTTFDEAVELFVGDGLVTS